MSAWDDRQQRISESEWLWIARQNRERAESELEKAKEEEKAARNSAARRGTE